MQKVYDGRKQNRLNAYICLLMSLICMVKAGRDVGTGEQYILLLVCMFTRVPFKNCCWIFDYGFHSAHLHLTCFDNRDSVLLSPKWQWTLFHQKDFSLGQGTLCGTQFLYLGFHQGLNLLPHCSTLQKSRWSRGQYFLKVQEP